MTGLSTHLRTLRGGLALVDPVSGTLRRLIALQYNPERLTRTIQPAAGSGASHAEPLRLTGPGVETIRLEAELDAADQLEQPGKFPDVVDTGLLPVLSALELILYPSSGQLQSNDRLANMGTLEIAPMEGPLVLFIWSKCRVLPVRVTDIGITEDEFDAALNPIRAKVSMTMKVLAPGDLPFSHRGSALFMSHLVQKEALAGRAGKGMLSMLGLGGLP